MNRLLASGLALALTTPGLSAQVPIGGAMSDDTSGPLVGGLVYHMTSNLSVPAGKTLTIGAGAIIKSVPLSGSVRVDGTLLAQGTALAPIVFTSLADDSAGGDTALDGPTVGAPEQWRGLDLRSGAGASVLEHVEVRFGGQASLPGIDLNSADATLTSVTVRDCHADGLSLSGDSFPTVTDCSFVDNGERAVDDVRLSALPGFQGGSASGNALNGQRVTVGALASDTTIAPVNLIGGTLISSQSLSIGSGLTLTLEAGVVVKSPSAAFSVDVVGRLVTQGTALEPVVFTSWADDQFGDDSNNDGPSTGAPGGWRGLELNGTEGSLLQHTLVRFGGQASLPAIDLNGSDATLLDVQVADALVDGISLSGDSFPTLVGCDITGCGAQAIDDVRVEALPGFSGNTASGNGLDVVSVGPSLVGADTTVSVDNLIGGVLVSDFDLVVPAGVRLTLLQGVVVKSPNGAFSIDVDGELRTEGTAGDPVVFTSWVDDAHGGDTNGDGPSTGVPGGWRGLDFADSSDASVLEYALVRCGGQASLPAVDLNAADITLLGVTVEQAQVDGLSLSNSSFPSVVGCDFRDNGVNAVDDVPLQALAGFSDNTASGNGLDGQRINQGLMPAGVFATIEAENVLGGALTLAVNLTVQAGAGLTLGPGVVLKPTNVAFELEVDGRLDTLGRPDAPVVLTSFLDDSAGGDTNGDGNASLPADSQLRGIDFSPVAEGGSLEGLEIRFAGQADLPALVCDSPLVTLRGIKVLSAHLDGFRIGAAAGEPRELVAFGCGGSGLVLSGGGYDVANATLVGNAVGVEREVAHTGSVRNTIAWDNVTNYTGFAAGDLLQSNGDAGLAGQDGNIDLDPLFEDGPAGDLRLTSGSPCIDRGQLFDLPGGQCAYGFPRSLDGSLNGQMRIDMGAHEFGNIVLTISGDATPGGLLTLTSEGDPSLDESFLFYGLWAPSLPLKNLGGIFVDLFDVYVVVPWSPAPAAVPVSIPLDFPAPFDLTVQQLSLQDLVGSPGNMSNPVVVSFHE